MLPDTSLVERIAEGVGAEKALEVFGDLLNGLIGEQLKRADVLAEDAKLTPETAYPILIAVCDYRRIVNRLTQRVTRGNNARAAQAEAQRGDLAPPRSE